MQNGLSLNKWLTLWIALSVLVILLNGCYSYQSLQYNGLDGVDINKEKGEKPTAVFNIRLYNPNDRSFKIRKVKADVMLNYYTLGSVTTTEKVKVGKNETFIIPVEVTLDRKDLNRALVQMGASLLGHPVNIVFRGHVYTRRFVLGKRFDFEHKESIGLNVLQRIRDQAK